MDGFSSGLAHLDEGYDEILNSLWRDVTERTEAPHSYPPALAGRAGGHLGARLGPCYLAAESAARLARLGSEWSLREVECQSFRYLQRPAGVLKSARIRREARAIIPLNFSDHSL